MGGGSYNYIVSKSRSVSYNTQSREEIFSQSHIDPEMVIKGKVRECVESEEHPNAFPIIIALDVTGSMGRIPYNLITGGFPEIMKKIMDNGVKDPQVCFLGIGDHYCDSAPIQVGQFESSDELLEKWLKLLYLEGGGGGNNGESYGLAHFFATYCVKADAFAHGRKGVLITVGDEPCHLNYSSSVINRLFGIPLEKNVVMSSLLKECRKHWEVYHINTPNFWAGRDHKVINSWEKLLGDHLIIGENKNGDDVPEIISNLILQCCNKGPSKPEVATAESDKQSHLR